MSTPSASTPLARQQYALQTIFSFFLGLMVLAFVGVGVNTFYPEPNELHAAEEQALWREIEAEQPKAMMPTEASPAASPKLIELQARAAELQERIAAERELWARNTSIILVLFATAVMGVSLIRNEQLRVISNGLLMGGLFTMVYGAAWVILSGHSVSRFVVIAFALLVTVGLGYLQFVRQRQRGVVSGSAAGAGADAEAVADLEARVRALESWRRS